ncbi:hypothetical protein [Photobacterium sanguinicancri]|uniref:hypothetical protein n=1 Tax=Photobacterium sanguinicancri TaxID=875932 RepID=UPI003D0BF839
MSKEQIKRQSNQDKGKASAKRLQDWMATNPKVPLNLMGKVNKANICRTLEIGYSTIGSNSDLKDLFDTLETLVANGQLQPESGEKAGSSKRVKELEAQLTNVQKKLLHTEAELELLKEGMTCDEYLIATMRAVR